jgi:hypothetical protein
MKHAVGGPSLCYVPVETERVVAREPTKTREEDNEKPRYKGEVYVPRRPRSLEA